MDFTVEVKVALKKGALDAEGETIAKSLKLLGFPVKKVDSLKFYKVVVEAKDKQDAVGKMTEAASKLLANPVIQDYEITVV
ncbi:MAG: phosphoribosylformylglycinamidine synthase subunit PurS [Candidatus Altiarchaeota archaeon]|nr:phosphoribosylformylglycinamidine synthase subunit PurS [Candidatus Altiarchaeota archaeon]